MKSVYNRFLEVGQRVLKLNFVCYQEIILHNLVILSAITCTL